MMLCISKITTAQVTFQKTYGGTGNDNRQTFQQTSDGGYIITGATNSFGAGVFDVYLIKTEVNGNISWAKTFGGTNDDYGYSVRQTSDGGYIVAGSTSSFGAGSSDVYLIKTDANGNSLWTKTYGGIGNEGGYSIKQTSDGGYIVAGWTDSFGAGNMDFYLIKTNANGDALWSKTYGGIGNDEGLSIDTTSGGGYIIAGWTDSFGAGSADVYLIRTDGGGNISWSRTFGGTGWDGASSIQQTSDGGYIVGGSTNSYGAGSVDVYLIKLDAFANTLWTKTFGGTGVDYVTALQQTSDGGYILAGTTNSFGTVYQDIYIIKTNVNGDTLWSKTYWGTANDESGYSVQQTSDGGYIIGGHTSSFGAGGDDFYLIKTDASGNSGCNQGNPSTIIGLPISQVTSPATTTSFPGTLVTSPTTLIGSGGIATTLCTTVGVAQSSDKSTNISIYPNPATDNITIESPQQAVIEISNIQGQLIKTYTSSENKTNVNVSLLPSGVYVVKVKTEKGIAVMKFIKE